MPEVMSRLFDSHLVECKLHVLPLDISLIFFHFKLHMNVIKRSAWIERRTYMRAPCISLCIYIGSSFKNDGKIMKIPNLEEMILILSLTSS